MAVKARDQVTVAVAVDVASVDNYYKLQSSTATPPTKPTTANPSGWSTTEPTYDGTSTNTLYICQKTTLTDGTFYWSAVSKSTSYEAAKTAYNLANSANEAANSAYERISSRGVQLVTNGNGFMGDNTNWSSLGFDGSKANGSPGSFTRTVGYAVVFSDEYFPIDASKEYLFEFDAMSVDGSARFYSFLAMYDVDKNDISAQQVLYFPNTLTTLAADLNPGDTTVKLTNAENWASTTAGHQRSLIFWDYTNSYGYTYPEETYSRNFYADVYADDSSVNKATGVITLKAPWSGLKKVAGTKVSQNRSGGTYNYAHVDKHAPAEWEHFSFVYSGLDLLHDGYDNAGKFRQGTGFARVGFLWNYHHTASNPQTQMWVTNISVKEAVASRTEGVEYISGTQAAATGTWTGVTKDSALYDGKVIVYHLPVAGSGDASLVLTLSGGTDTDAIPIFHYYSTTSNTSTVQRVTTHYPAGSSVLMTYDATNVRWLISNYNTNVNQVDRINHNNALHSASANNTGKTYVVTASSVIGYVDTLSGYQTIIVGSVINLSKPILWGTGNVAVNKTFTNAYEIFGGCTLRNNVAGWTGTQYATAYLRGTLNGSNMTVESITSTIPSVEDGYVYLPLGELYSTYQITFRSSSELYVYKDGAFGPTSIREAAAAAKTATNYIHADSTGIRIANADPATATTYQHQTATNTEFVVEGTSLVDIGGSGTRIGDVSGAHTVQEATGFNVYQGTKSVAEFGAVTRIGNDGSSRVEMSKDRFATYDAIGAQAFTIEPSSDYGWVTASRTKFNANPVIGNLTNDDGSIRATATVTPHPSLPKADAIGLPVVVYLEHYESHELIEEVVISTVVGTSTTVQKTYRLASDASETDGYGVAISQVTKTVIESGVQKEYVDGTVTLTAASGSMPRPLSMAGNYVRIARIEYPQYYNLAAIRVGTEAGPHVNVGSYAIDMSAGDLSMSLSDGSPQMFFLDAPNVVFQDTSDTSHIYDMDELTDLLDRLLTVSTTTCSVGTGASSIAINNIERAGNVVTITLATIKLASNISAGGGSGTIATVPSGYRPSHNLYFPFMVYGQTGVYGYARIGSNGVVSLRNGSTTAINATNAEICFTGTYIIE